MVVSPILCSENFSCYEFLEFVLVWEVRQFWFPLLDLRYLPLSISWHLHAFVFSAYVIDMISTLTFESL